MVAARGHGAGRALPRSRPLQGGERHAGPRRRRPAADRRDRQAARLCSRDRHAGAAGRRRIRHRADWRTAACGHRDAGTAPDRCAGAGIRPGRQPGHRRRQHRHCAAERDRRRAVQRRCGTPAAGGRYGPVSRQGGGQGHLSVLCGRNEPETAGTAGARGRHPGSDRARTSSGCTISRSSIWPSGRSSEPRRCSAGTTRCGARSRRKRSSRWPRKPA